MEISSFNSHLSLKAFCVLSFSKLIRESVKHQMNLSMVLCQLVEALREDVICLEKVLNSLLLCFLARDYSCSAMEISMDFFHVLLPFVRRFFISYDRDASLWPWCSTRLISSLSLEVVLCSTPIARYLCLLSRCCLSEHSLPGSSSWPNILLLLVYSRKSF